MVEATVDPSKIASDLMAELNLDDAELTTITTLVNTAVEIVKRSTDAPADDALTVPAIKTMAQAMYYDRNLSDGMPRGLLMMLTHLQAVDTGGDNDGK
ncbi:hypothetical protein [Lacticaseibacillus mingshuiensis]|uniref:Phage gp6-like head-tail connector protein n=1 Tax=Lacticaseibacillus mingshuiensis TaxID=2799574 RepID=A0ABW4CGN4_9LACO|nr:hypothetical protein [Lacticaseibacillus mingshuiensis]